MEKFPIKNQVLCEEMFDEYYPHVLLASYYKDNYLVELYTEYDFMINMVFFIVIINDGSDIHEMYYTYLRNAVNCFNNSIKNERSN